MQMKFKGAVDDILEWTTFKGTVHNISYGNDI